MKPPCIKDGVKCEKRVPGCQDRCEDMQQWQEKVRMRRTQRAQEAESVKYHVDACERMRRKRKSK